MIYFLNSQNHTLKENNIYIFLNGYCTQTILIKTIEYTALVFHVYVKTIT